MRILLFGYSGFLGNHFLQVAKKAPQELVLIGRSRPQYSLGPNLSWIKSDINQLRNHLTHLGRVDVVVNFLWEGLPQRDEWMNQKNLLNQIAIFDAMEALKFDKLVCAGSSLEYIESEEKLNESSVSDSSDNFALTKLQVLSEAKQRFASVVWPRVFFSYGSGQHSKSLLNSVYDSLRSSGTFSLQNSSHTNDFIHATDVARAFLALVQDSKSDGIFNIGSGKPTSNEFMAKLLSVLYCQQGGENIYRDYDERPIVKRSRIADITKITQSTNWAPSISLEQGIQEFLRARNLSRSN
jgi:dTDP-6-deoxy-L-talose 4-dehydrogenase (NAD+)